MSEGTIADVLDGRARWCVVLGDCRDVLPALEDKSVAHVITDPPYESGAHTLQRRVKTQDGPDRDNPWGGADGRPATPSPLVCAHLRGATGMGGRRDGSAVVAVGGGLLSGGGRDEVV